MILKNIPVYIYDGDIFYLPGFAISGLKNAAIVLIN